MGFCSDPVGMLITKDIVFFIAEIVIMCSQKQFKISLFWGILDWRSHNPILTDTNKKEAGAQPASEIKQGGGCVSSVEFLLYFFQQLTPSHATLQTVCQGCCLRQSIPQAFLSSHKYFHRSLDSDQWLEEEKNRLEKKMKILILDPMPTRTIKCPFFPTPSRHIQSRHIHIPERLPTASLVHKRPYVASGGPKNITFNFCQKKKMEVTF